VIISAEGKKESDSAFHEKSKEKRDSEFHLEGRNLKAQEKQEAHLFFQGGVPHAIVVQEPEKEKNC